ncbi:MAG TPA: class I SAM-dependent methyltransferase [Gemmatimonadales bacterium]|nr:class I SAM-dependent methyltransferase [Gemmatimonadales bacterium]
MTEPTTGSNAPQGEPWQLQLFRRSLKKRQTVDALLGHLPPVQGRLCLELGCGTGLTSYFLRQRGGTWVSADFERDHVRSARQLVRDRILQVGDRQLPFATGSFDVVAAINFLEHIRDDETFFAEMVRVLKPGGDFLFMAPKGDAGRPGYALKRALGFTADQEGFGHARDGYPRAAARAIMERHGIRVQGQATYCRFFTESLEDLLNYAYHRKAMKAKDTTEQDFHGDTAPMSADALNKVGTAYKVYSAIYPALRAWTMLDGLIPFSEGYMMATWGKKAA